MSRLTDRIRNHGAIALLSDTLVVLAQIQSPDDAAAFESLEHLRHVLERLSNLIDDAEPTLVSPELLQRLAAPLSALRVNVDLYVSSGVAANLANAEANLDALIAEVGWPLAYSFKKPIGIRQYAGAYHDGLDSYLVSARQQVEQLSVQIAALKAEVVSAQEAVATAAAAAVTDVNAETAQAAAQVERRASDAETHITTAVAAADQQLGALGASVEAHRARLDSLTETFNAQFAAEQKTRQAEGDTALADEVAKHNAVRTEATTSYQAALADEVAKHGAARGKAQAAVEAAMARWTSTAEVFLAQLGEKERQANNLLGALGQRGVVAGFGKYADEQRGRADVFRIIALMFGTLAVLWSLGVAMVAVNSSFEWAAVLKMLVSIPLLLVAGYAIQQSGRHRDSERDARRSELELAAIDPYLANLPPEKRDEIKAALAEKMFARIPTDQVPPILNRVFDLLDKAIKKG